MTAAAEGPPKVAGPPVVYLPVELDEDGGVQNIRMVALEDGRVALLGYTALDRFMRCCGEGHAWMVFDTEKLDELRQTKHFDVNYLDVPLPLHLRTPAAPVEGQA
jgi:hypothetical protein